MPYSFGVRARWILLAALILWAAGAAYWLLDPERALRRRAPDLPPDMARHLVRDDDAAFGRYAREVGIVELREAYFVLGKTIDYGTSDAFTRTTAAVAAPRRRLAVAMTENYLCPDYQRDFEFKARLSPDQNIALRRLDDEARRLNSDTALDPAERIRRMEAVRGSYQSLGYMRGVLLAEGSLATQAVRLDRPDEHLRHIRRACAIADSIGETYLKCQHLGSMGVAYRALGMVDSMRACYDEALEIARRSRFPDQFPRLLFFQAGYQADQGRLATATEMILDGQRQCVEMGGGGMLLRFVVDAMDHFAALGCWDIVERLLDQCPVLIRRLRGTFSEPQYTVFAQTAERHRFAVHLIRRRYDEAMKVLNRLERVWRTPSSTRYGELLDEASEHLMRAGRPADALPWIERGLAYTDTFHMPEYGTPLALRLVAARLATGSPDLARAALDDFDRRSAAYPYHARNLLVARDVLEARLLEQAGERALARARLDRALARLRQRAQAMEPGPQAYLALSAENDLRDAMHRLLTSPVDGYRFELEWRALPGELGRTHRPFHARTAHPSRPPPGSIHCVYRFEPRSIVRWTSTSEGISRDTLELAAVDCRREIDAILKEIGQHEPDASSAARLHRLARRLLPSQVLSAGSHAGGTLLIAPDGPLALLPFELLNLSPNGFQPLAQQWNVAYGDRTARNSGIPKGPPSILADPLPAPSIRRRTSPAALREARAEAQAVRRAWPDARLLEGPGATKAAVLDTWRHASRIHVAAHLMRNPEIPFVAYFPMAPPSVGASVEDAYLEIADIRATDLRGCELVMLSACASGEPYVTPEDHLGPSMGKAFLDAGASAVIQTMWPVEDAEARRFAERFVATWKPGTDPVAALSETRRAAIRAGEPPRVWAAWSIHVTGVPKSTHASRASAALDRAR